MSKKKPNKINKKFITEKMTELALGTLSGTIELIDVPATVKIPKQILDIVEHVSKVYGVPVKSSIDSMASQGIVTSIHQLTEEATGQETVPAPDQATMNELTKLPAFEQMTGNLGKLTEQLSSLKEMAKMFEQFSEMVDANSKDPSGNTPKS